MADRLIKKSTEYLTFSGSATQTITIASNYTASVKFLDLSAIAATAVTVMIGLVPVWKGTTNVSPVQLKFGEGRGSGVAGDNITIQSDGAIEIFVGVFQTISD